MAKAPSNLLPLPEPVIRHHGLTVFGPMKEWRERKRVPPVLLLTGTAGIGKRALAYFVAQWILCEKSGFEAAAADENQGGFFGGMDIAEAELPATQVGAPVPCGQCSSCLRAVKGNWVDFTEIAPEDEEGETLKIDQFRKLKTSIGFGAHESAYRIVLIPNADRMTPQAANSVLKLLEEPPPGWVFFLTASDPTLVLPTVLSRCQTLRLKPFSPEELEELLGLSGIPADRRRICADLAQGSWNKAVALASDEIWEQRKVFFEFLKEPSAAVNTLVDWAAGSNANFDILVDQLENFSADLIRWTIGPQSARPEAQPWLNSDGRNALIAQAQGAVRALGGVEAAREFWTERAGRLAQVRQEALAPLNRKLLVQDLLLPWILAKGRPA